MPINLSIGMPNLDEQTARDLEVFSGEIHFDPTKTVQSLFPNEYPAEALHATIRIGDYANAKILFLEALEDGNNIKACVHEEQCRRIFDTLPTFARW